MLLLIESGPEKPTAFDHPRATLISVIHMPLCTSIGGAGTWIWLAQDAGKRKVRLLVRAAPVRCCTLTRDNFTKFHSIVSSFLSF
jgi:hypothetical protein